jgi:hypothetical protein
MGSGVTGYKTQIHQIVKSRPKLSNSCFKSGLLGLTDIVAIIESVETKICVSNPK